MVNPSSLSLSLSFFLFFLLVFCFLLFFFFFSSFFMSVLFSFLSPFSLQPATNFCSHAQLQPQSFSLRRVLKARGRLQLSVSFLSPPSLPLPPPPPHPFPPSTLPTPLLVARLFPHSRAARKQTHTHSRFTNVNRSIIGCPCCKPIDHWIVILQTQAARLRAGICFGSSAAVKDASQPAAGTQF